MKHLPITLKIPKSISNKALGYLALEQYKDAKNLANQIIKSNPADLFAYSVLVQTLQHEKKSFEEILKAIPENYRYLEIPATAIAFIACERKNFEEAIKWFKKAMKNKDIEANTLAELKGALSSTLLNLFVDKPFAAAKYTKSIDEEKRELLKDCIKYSTEAWEAIAESISKNLRLGWLYNRAIARSILGHREKAIQDIKKVLDIDPEHIFAKRLLALLYAENDVSKAISILIDMEYTEDCPDIKPLLGEFLYVEKKYIESKKDTK